MTADLVQITRSIGSTTAPLAAVTAFGTAAVVVMITALMTRNRAHVDVNKLAQIQVCTVVI
jgi:hypothetical protein